MKKIILILITFSLHYTAAQNISADEVLNKVKAEFAKIDDYQVDISIKIDVDFLKIPETKGIIYYKKPDKIKLHSDSFALIPKEGLNFSPDQFLGFDYSAIMVREEKYKGNDNYVIKVVPLVDTTDIILSTLWVDKEKPVITKIETTTKKNGTVSITLEYDNESNILLPSKLELHLDLENFKVPRSITGTIRKDSDKEKPDRVNGKVIITYTNYIINNGIDDNIFE